MEPINYSIQAQNPTESMLRGLQMGATIGGAIQQQQEKEKALLLQQSMQADLAGLAMNPNASAQDYAAMMVKYPQLSEHFKRSWDTLNADQQQSNMSHAMQVYAALNAGKTDIAQQLISDRATAYANAGDKKNADLYGTMAKLVATSPETAKTSAGLMLASTLGADKFAQAFPALGAEQRAQELQPGAVKKGNAEADIKTIEARNTPQRLALESQQTAANIRNIDSQITERAARMNLDRDRLQTETETKLYELGQRATTLDPSAQKLINDAAAASVAAEQSAGQMNDLAGRLEKDDMRSGTLWVGPAEWIKKATGNQDAWTSMRQEYTRLRNSMAVKSLPPGPATDRDIDMALKGFPSDTADSATMASFLRGMAKLSQRDAISESVKSEWVNSVGYLGRAKTDIVVDGVNVPKGMTFPEFMTRYMPTKIKQRDIEQGQAAVQQRGYMKYSTPGAQ